MTSTLLLFGFPLFWIVYTLIFLRVSKKWRQEGVDDEDSA